MIGLAGWAVANSPAAMFMRVLGRSAARSAWACTWPVGGAALPASKASGAACGGISSPLPPVCCRCPACPCALLLGALWGWLPCGLVYSTLLWAASQGNALDSALLMLAFGLGTWPVLLATGLAAERVTALLRKRSVRMAGGLLVIVFGIWTLPGPHQHWLMGH